MLDFRHDLLHPSPRSCYTRGMPLPARKIDPLPDSSPRFPREVAEKPHEAVFRPLRKPDGELVVEQLPLTLDVLLDPRIEDQMSQTRPHERHLGPLADTLERFLERQDGVAVMSDMMILWKKMGERDVAPDVCVVKGVRDREAIDESFDPAAEGVGPCLVFEVVSESTRAVKEKDEKKNPPLFERMKVEDLVLVYPRRPVKRSRLRLDVKRLDA
ncbi:MAG: Uma2 family endonuclease, partial [bacterium]|nr:Uma2 family endonuclease [bacterium]